MVGYEGSHIYKLYNPVGRKIVRAKDVVFNEISSNSINVQTPPNSESTFSENSMDSTSTSHHPYTTTSAPLGPETSQVPEKPKTQEFPQWPF